MTDKKSKEVTIQQILDEGKKKEKTLSLGDGNFVKYIDPTNKEVKALKKEAKKKVHLERQGVLLDNPNPSKEDLEKIEKDLSARENEIAGNLIVWKGLNKADSTVTLDMLENLPSSVTASFELQLLGEQYDGIDEERLGKLKNYQEVKQALT